MKKLELMITEDGKNISKHFKAENLSSAEILGFLEMAKYDLLLKINKKPRKHDKDQILSK